MNRLTTEQIQFIDNYLFNSGVHYIDIRCEMTDHVATAIEEKDGDFGHNFSVFMASNKRELMASNRLFKKNALSKALKMFFGNYKKPLFLMGTALLMVLTFVMANVAGYEEVSSVFLIMQTGIHLCFYISWIYFWIVKSNRYSVIDRLLIISFFLPMFLRFENNVDNEVVMLVFFSVYTSLTLTLLFTIFQFHRTYKLRYNG